MDCRSFLVTPYLPLSSSHLCLQNGLHFIALRCVALRCAALRCALFVRGLRAQMEHFTTNIGNLREGRWGSLLLAAVSHADLGHLAGNLFSLLMFAHKPYAALGLRRFLGLYALGGLACSLTHCAHNWLSGRTLPPLAPNDFYAVQQFLRGGWVLQTRGSGNGMLGSRLR